MFHPSSKLTIYIYIPFHTIPLELFAINIVCAPRVIYKATENTVLFLYLVFEIFNTQSKINGKMINFIKWSLF